ncbi:uncharacterized protein V6R79_009401 [Siganus canaliculatus]
MSPTWASVYILVLLGAVYAASAKSIHHNPENLKTVHDSIANTLELTQTELFSNQPFTAVIECIINSCQESENLHLMNVTLDVYMKIFSSILKHGDEAGSLLNQLPSNKRSKVESDLKTLQSGMKSLKSLLGHPNQNQDREKVLNELDQIDKSPPLHCGDHLEKFLTKLRIQIRRADPSSVGNLRSSSQNPEPAPDSSMNAVENVTGP